MDTVISGPSSPVTSLIQGENAVNTKNNLLKPQIVYDFKFDNSKNPFVPFADGFDIKTTPNGYIHPFKEQETKYPVHLFDIKETLYPPIEKTPITIVENTEKLNEMIEILKCQKEIAVDLEAHSQRSYLGFTCLIQISTRTEDFIVDAIVLRDSLNALNSVFGDPNIVKVFHGADYDIAWLQRDFSVFVRPLFDTYHASHCLKMPKHSLQYLLQHYTAISLDKKMQLADWRLRPLTDEMLSYARSDTHYLLYVYDRMRRELISQGSEYLEKTLSLSRSTSLNIFKKPDARDPNFSSDTKFLATIVSANHDGKKRRILSLLAARLLHLRDEIARTEDESPNYVVPNWALAKCISNHKLILDSKKGSNESLMNIWKGFTKIPQLIDNIVDAMKKAVEDHNASESHLNITKRKIVDEPMPQAKHIRFDENFENSRVMEGNLNSVASDKMQMVQPHARENLKEFPSPEKTHSSLFGEESDSSDE